MSWFTSWLPSFNFTIPSLIQSRFISFVLKKYLGRFLKPGQLDYSQIDSQIGSGYFQVNHLLLDPEAINVYLQHQPISLHSGTLSSVKARIPWPNPLASTLGFSLASLHLVFHIVPPSRTSTRTEDLGDSVASVAESFIHQELSPTDEKQLWESFHESSVPGGLGASLPTDKDKDKDPAGISLFASLIENLLARFEFDARDVKVTILNPLEGTSDSVVLRVDEVRYFTEAGHGQGQGASRTVSIEGLRVAIGRGRGRVHSIHRSTTRAATAALSLQPSTPRLRARSSSGSSDMDEDTHLAMSQSIVGFPPPLHYQRSMKRSTSPSSSVASSLYQSALDERGDEGEGEEGEAGETQGSLGMEIREDEWRDEEHDEDEDEDEDEDGEDEDEPEVVLTFGTQPIVIRLTTPSPSPSPSSSSLHPHSQDDLAHRNPSGTASSLTRDEREAEREHYYKHEEHEEDQHPDDEDEDLHISLSIHIIACALKPWHVRTLVGFGRGVSGTGTGTGIGSGSLDPAGPVFGRVKEKEGGRDGGKERERERYRGKENVNENQTENPPISLPPFKFSAQIRGVVILLDADADEGAEDFSSSVADADADVDAQSKAKVKAKTDAQVKAKAKTDAQAKAPRAKAKTQKTQKTTSSSLDKFFTHPLVPPKSLHPHGYGYGYGYTRIHLDGVGVAGSVSVGEPVGVGEPDTALRTMRTETKMETKMSVEGTLSDVSVFMFVAEPEAREDLSGERGEEEDPKPLKVEHTLRAFPLLITDHQLGSQYAVQHVHPLCSSSFSTAAPSSSSTHTHNHTHTSTSTPTPSSSSSSHKYPTLPTFEIPDWTDPRTRAFGYKISQWRTRVGGGVGGGVVAGKDGKALSVRFSRSVGVGSTSVGGMSGRERTRTRTGTSSGNNTRRNTKTKSKTKTTTQTSTKTKDDIDIRISPLHVRIDLERMFRPGGLVSYLERVVPSPSSSPGGEGGRPRGRGRGGREEEDEEMLEPLGLEGIYGGYEYGYGLGEGTGQGEGEGQEEGTGSESESEGSNSTLDEFKASMLGLGSVPSGKRQRGYKTKAKTRMRKGVWSAPPRDLRSTDDVDYAEDINDADDLDPFGEPELADDGSGRFTVPVRPVKKRESLQPDSGEVQGGEDREQHENENETERSVVVRVPMIRVSLGCPSPMKYLGLGKAQGGQRSGIVVVDVHDMRIAFGSGDKPVGAHPTHGGGYTTAEPTARFAREEFVIPASPSPSRRPSPSVVHGVLPGTPRATAMRVAPGGTAMGAVNPSTTANFKTNNNNTGNDEIKDESVQMKIQFRRAVLGASVVGKPSASSRAAAVGVVAFASIGGLSEEMSRDYDHDHDHGGIDERYGGGMGDVDGDGERDGPAPLQPCIRILKPSAPSSSSSSPLPPSPSAPAVMALSVDIPSIHADLSKESFDGLQYFADDLTQFFERLGQVPSGVDDLGSSSSPAFASGFGPGGEDMEGTHGTTKMKAKAKVEAESLIGSRFFAKSRMGSMNSTTVGGGGSGTAESVVKVTVTEAFVRLCVARTDGNTLNTLSSSSPRPFDLRVSDLDVLLELNPDGKQQTILTMDVLDVSVTNLAQDGSVQTFLKLSSPHSLKTTPKSIVKLRFSTTVAPETGSKETRIKLTLCGFTYTFFADLTWIADLASFAKNPPGTFEAVIPSDCTRIFVKVLDGSVRVFAPTHPGGLVSHLQELEFSTDVVGDSKDSSFHINATSLSVLALDDGARQEAVVDTHRSMRGVAAWLASGYALIFEVPELDTFVVNHLNSDPQWKVDIHRLGFRLHMCADTMTAVSAIFSDLGELGKSEDDIPEPTTNVPSVVGSSISVERNIMSSVDDLQFKKAPEIGPPPDLIDDDLPTNIDYLGDSFNPGGGLRELTDDDLDDFDNDDFAADHIADADPNIISRIGGETIKLLEPTGLEVVEDYFLTIPPETKSSAAGLGASKISVRVFEGNINVFLYDGYDWVKTRRVIEEEVKEMRKRLAKIRQLVANGQVEDPALEDTSALLYNSIHIGLDDDEDALGEPAALIAAIDRELKEDLETTSWQSLPTFHGGAPSSKQSRTPHVKVHGKRLTRSRAPSIEFSLQGLRAEFDKFHDDDPLVSRTFVTVKDVEILDHIKTSTWKKFLTQLRSDSRGNVRVTDSDMVMVELKGVRPVPGNSSEEARLKAKILPLRLYVDQDAVDFLKKFFSFKDPHAIPSVEGSESPEAYIQHGEIFPIDLKLDYKPRRVDYRALKQGKTIELMNFFHFDGAEMTLRHITLAGITGWGKFFELLNDLWTPDVKATQLAEVISGVAPIRSVVNVGSGVADLILLPIAQYKKDGRIVRGVQKGAKAFVKSTAIEAIKMGAQLATGTQVILEQAENILGGTPNSTVTAEALQAASDDFTLENDELDEETADLISKYAQQPTDLKEGVQHAYKSLHRNLSSAAQTILAVPMEVYERSGNEGPVRAVIRAVPIAVLKPMIGASEAVSKTLQGLHNTLDPNVRHDNEAKYKLR